MTREEEIKVSALKYLDDFNPDDCGIVCGICKEDIYAAFMAGSRYADIHPNLSSLWHYVNENPKEGTDILFIAKNGKVHKASKIDSALYEWLKGNNDIKRWAYISDMLPKNIVN